MHALFYDITEYTGYSSKKYVVNNNNEIFYVYIVHRVSAQKATILTLSLTSQNTLDVGTGCGSRRPHS